VLHNSTADRVQHKTNDIVNIQLFISAVRFCCFHGSTEYCRDVFSRFPLCDQLEHLPFPHG